MGALGGPGGRTPGYARALSGAYRKRAARASPLMARTAPVPRAKNRVNKAS